ncbi:MAG: hypothetical protein OYK82_06520 [Gammaproteobacteria bacterium]|nr:hypothetical protein [Gammaproteobacteria bacterium]
MRRLGSGGVSLRLRGVSIPRPVPGLLLVLAVVFLTARAWTSMEWGNRLFRSGRLSAAADVYAARVDTTASGARASFNLGTALLHLGSDEAERYLLRATGGRDSAAVQRSHYNLTVRLLSGVEPDTDPFAAIPLLSGAIDHGRAALRLDPRDDDARWNLALAIRAYAEVAEVFEEGPAESDTEVQAPEEESEEGGSESESGGAGEELEDITPPDSQGRPAGAAEGVREALSREDPGSLTEAAIADILAGHLDDTERLVRAILWAGRPTVDRRSREPFPGGDW